MIIGNGQICMDPKKVQVIEEWPISKNKMNYNNSWDLQTSTDDS